MLNYCIFIFLLTISMNTKLLLKKEHKENRNKRGTGCSHSKQLQKPNMKTGKGAWRYISRLDAAAPLTSNTQGGREPRSTDGDAALDNYGKGRQTAKETHLKMRLKRGLGALKIRK